MYIGYMKRISLYLSIPQLTALTVQAKRLGLSLSELIRRVLDAYLNQQKD
jgi:hypothetical protein